MDSRSTQLELFFLPFLAPGHIIPLSDMARLFAARGEKVTIITTPMNARLLQKSIDKDSKSGLQISLHILKFSPQDFGLPEGCENFYSITDLESATKLYYAMEKLREQIEQLIYDRRPDCIISDKFYPWTSDVAIQLGIQRIVFNATCIFALCLFDCMRGPDAPHLKAQSDSETFLVPGLPDPITMTRSQLPSHVWPPTGYTQLMEIWREAELKSFGVVANNFYEIEAEYAEHYKKVMGHKVWHVGPVSLIHRDNTDKAERGHKTAVDEHECMSWLDSNDPDSVLYVCFGSLCHFPDEQLFEIAAALEASGRQFIWVVFGKDDEKEEDKEKWLPEGFEERIKEGNKGMIIKGWAPQVLILDHPSVGGFLTHCGWNSVLEGVSAGLPMITWPLYAEHFNNEKLVTQVLKIGIEVGVKDWKLWVDAGKKVTKRENIEEAVAQLMGGGDEAVERRKRARKLGEIAKNSVKEGGSSYRNLTALIDELKSLKASRVEA